MNNVAIINRGGESPRLKWLSTLRGLAILLVFISHLKFGDEWKNELFILGRIGVVIFLMMAGFLLQMIGLIGCISKKENKALSPKELRYIMIFELTLAIAAPLSYPNWWAYLVAYNIGILLFYIFKNFNLANHYASSFSRVGFTFFLGAQIPIYAITLICPNVASLPFCVIVLLPFLSTLLFAWLMTRYIEEPLLKWGKMVMKE